MPKKKAYRVDEHYNGTLTVEAVVVKSQSSKKIVLASRHAFGFRTEFEPGEIDFAPAAALWRFIETQKAKLKLIEEQQRRCAYAAEWADAELEKLSDKFSLLDQHRGRKRS